MLQPNGGLLVQYPPLNSRLMENQEATMLTVDGRCGCARCEAGSKNIYRMVGECWNCHATPILVLYREGDPAAPQDCPTCGGRQQVHVTRLATPDEVPAA